MRLGVRLRRSFLCHGQRRQSLPSLGLSERAISSQATDAASRMMDRFANSITIRRQIIDANQLQKLLLTLGRTQVNEVDISIEPPRKGTPVPAGYHLVYFTPAAIEGNLGADGSDRTYNPPDHFTRRMWAGGHMCWPSANISTPVQLRVGDQAEEHTRFVSAVPKKSSSGGEMVLVELEKEIRTPRGCAVLDRRSWIFRPEVDLETNFEYGTASEIYNRPSTMRDFSSDNDAGTIRQVCWSPVGLFRFSALTFNGHMIHYNQEWCKSVEGHPNTVVHGPLNLICILDYWRDVYGKGTGPSSIKYRALSPLYAGETYMIRTQQFGQNTGGLTRGIIAERDGKTCMRAEITS
ncbi:hypothetical protein HIM_09221 [Hirsutella minnesotensis 3608]|uniref:Mesaconyl-C4 CoA hydratase n=1 Tax=Hirsutella minnesotensis 3608 TaxID=1043627 RepID=A0A0F7ZLR7_9HYPO|nr:hypothetical protein HIM_09221 [Hirsutella minnesotensis 3608]